MKLSLTVVLFLSSLLLFSQGAQKKIVIVDTLTSEQKNARNPILLRSELDSLVAVNNLNNQLKQSDDPKGSINTSRETYLMILLGIASLLVILQILSLYSSRKRKRELIDVINRQNAYLDMQIALLTDGQKTDSDFSSSNIRNWKGKDLSQEPESKTSSLKVKIEKLAKEKQQLSDELSEYRNKYEAVQESFSKTFKIKNYPGANNGKTETEMMLGLLENERQFTTSVYEKFIKPVNTILESNKNNPANISEIERNRLLELLISISLLYIEYLYLRISELSLGGKIVDRITDIKSGSGINTSMLKKLDTEHGNKALVLHIALSKINMNNLSYPVFDETNLNKQS